VAHSGARLRERVAALLYERDWRHEDQSTLAQKVGFGRIVASEIEVLEY
jgi:hypothetical protein